MLKLIAISFILFSLQFAKAAERDSTHHCFLLDFNYTAIILETGQSIPIREKSLKDLPNGMGNYFNDLTGGSAWGFLSFGLYYKDRFGVEFVFRYNDFSSDDTEFKKYISSKYPDYYQQDILNTYTYGFDGLQYRMCYKFHVKKFVIEPKLQLGINDYSESSGGFVLKKIGDNSFIDYRVQGINLQKNNYSYHGILNLTRRMDPFKEVCKFEVGLKFEYMLAPTTYKYIVSESIYGLSSTTNEYIIKRMHPAFSIEACIYLVFGYGMY